MLQVRAGRRPLALDTEGAPPAAWRRVTTWRRSDRVLWRFVLDDVVVLTEGGDGEPFVLGGGRALWEALAHGTELDPLAERLGAGDSKQDLSSLLESLAEAGLIERLEA